MTTKAWDQTSKADNTYLLNVSIVCQNIHNREKIKMQIVI